MLTATKAKIEPGKLLINGEWVDASKHFNTINPATGEVLTQIAEASAAEVDLAVQSARQAFEDRNGAWRLFRRRGRYRVLR